MLDLSGVVSSLNLVIEWFILKTWPLLNKSLHYDWQEYWSQFMEQDYPISSFFNQEVLVHPLLVLYSIYSSLYGSLNCSSIRVVKPFIRALNSIIGALISITILMWMWLPLLQLFETCNTISKMKIIERGF